MSELKGLSVLIIEPHSGMRANLQGMLTQCGLSGIDCASGSSYAVRQLHARSYDLILCENDLEGGQDGQQMLEDLRHHKLINSSTLFFMVTGENHTSKVTSAAELAPAGYILKPFAVESMLERIRRALDKRDALRPVRQLIDLGCEHEALAACASGAEAHPRYAADFMRLRAELHLLLGEAALAEPVYAELYVTKAFGWARLGQAKTLYLRRRHPEAVAMLQALLRSHPRFLDAYDWLARVYEAMGDLPRAQAVLGEAAARSPHALRRLRHLGEVALETGDVESAERAFREVVGKGQYSEFRNPEDHARLALALVQKGDPVRAAKVIRDLDKSMAGRKNSLVCSAIASAMLHEYTGNDERLDEALDSALRGCRGSSGLSSRIQLELARSCLQNGKEERGAELLREVMRNATDQAALDKISAAIGRAGHAALAETLARESRQQVADMVAAGAARANQGDYRGAVELMLVAVGRLPDNAHVVFNAAVAVLKCLEHGGWDERLGPQAVRLVGEVRRLDPGNPKLTALAGLHQEILRKYNVHANRLRDAVARML